MKRALDEKRKETIKLLLSEGYTVGDLADILGISRQTVWRIKYASQNEGLTGVPKTDIIPLEDET